MWKNGILHFLVGTCLIVELVFACRCGIVEENDRFCGSTFAVIVRVEDNGQVVDNDRVYQVTELWNIKPKSPPASVARNKIFTATEFAACGVMLDQGSIYLLAGQHMDDSSGMTTKRYLGLCSVVRQLTDVEYTTYQPPVCHGHL